MGVQDPSLGMSVDAFVKYTNRYRRDKLRSDLRALQTNAEKEKEADIVMVVNIPRSRHGEEKCVEAKARELRDFADFDVYDIVDIPKDANVIGTEWVLVEKEIK